MAIEDCPKDWIDAQNLKMGCINLNGTKSMAWNDAQDFCHSLNINAHLVEIFSEEQQQFMVLQALLHEDQGILYLLWLPYFLLFIFCKKFLQNWCFLQTKNKKKAKKNQQHI